MHRLSSCHYVIWFFVLEVSAISISKFNLDCCALVVPTAAVGSFEVLMAWVHIGLYGRLNFRGVHVAQLHGNDALNEA